MEKNENAIMQRLARLEREMILWRALALGAAMFLTMALAQDRTQQEIRLASADGRQVVVLSSRGIELSDHDKKLGEIGFETVGDGDDQEAFIKLSGEVMSSRMFVQEEKNRLALRPDRVAFAENDLSRAMLTPDGVQLQDREGRSKISLTTPEQGLGGLDFVENGNVILSLGAFGKFRVDNPPRRDAGAIHIGDFGPDPKTRLITAADSELHTTH
jgi:hypothetical protein